MARLPIRWLRPRRNVNVVEDAFGNQVAEFTPEQAAGLLQDIQNIDFSGVTSIFDAPGAPRPTLVDGEVVFVETPVAAEPESCRSCAISRTGGSTVKRSVWRSIFACRSNDDNDDTGKFRRTRCGSDTYNPRCPDTPAAAAQPQQHRSYRRLTLTLTNLICSFSAMSLF